MRGDVTLAGKRAVLRALDVPAGQFVELRALYPRRAFASTGAMRVEEGPGLEKIAAEELADAEAYERDRERIDDWIAHPLRAILALAASSCGFCACERSAANKQNKNTSFLMVGKSQASYE